MYIEQTLSGTRLGTTGSIDLRIRLDTSLPTSGTVNFYVAANAANGNNQDDSGDHVYTATYSLTAAPAVTLPVISAVVNGATFAAGIEAGSWVTIQGTNLTAGTTQPHVGFERLRKRHTDAVG